MVSQKRLVIVNIGLTMLAVLLLLNLFEVKLPSLGKVSYLLDEEQPLCAVQWKDEFTVWNDIDACCLEARKQLECFSKKAEVEGKTFDKVCQTATEGVSKYWLNNKAYNYCKLQVIW